MSGGLSEATRAKLRRRLERMAARLDRRARSLRQGGLERPLHESVGELASYDQHTSDLAAETFERSKDLGLLERVQLTGQEVHDALRRLDEGRYGYCEQCGRFIGTARLLALPWARRCAACQQAHDLEEERRVEDRAVGRRPLEEAALMPPFGRADQRNAGETGFDPGDVWQALARYGNANSPQDVPGAVDYDETWEGADTEQPGGVTEVEYIPDMAGTGVVDYDQVYPDPSTSGRRRARRGPTEETGGDDDLEGDRWM
ncbi:TraR/DksA C4-type zinc finger protein [Geochorda subterranea]|uniref:TraR/DksA C4-type zinc finger protein n=1 Tax=Geochorda subterranea TaxID=3109564 RepID=A0ABZ1BL34_9FIRM|nr:TraR/DksA C4-type zinc finger protein [Limnochorda sp. LNt]WRP13409.1 TraR/DksA C4-type zinc finger protein [Limnochorda sp. LNt]